MRVGFWRLGATCAGIARAYASPMTSECTPAAPATPRTRHPLALRLQCRNEWVTGQGTLAEVAKRHNVPPQTLVAWYRRENWTDARARWLERQLSDNETPAKPHAYAAKPEYSDDATHARQIQRLEAQLESLDNVLDNAKTADDWHKLSTARQRLFEQWRILSGIPLPGSRKPSKERPRRQACYAPVEPELIEPVPAELRESEPGAFAPVVLPSPAQASEPAAAAPGQPAAPAPNAPQPTAPAEKPAVRPAPPAWVPAPLASSPLIQKAGPPARMVRLSDGKLGYAPVVPTPVKRP